MICIDLYCASSRDTVAVKINAAVLPDPQTTPVQSSLLSDAGTFHVSLHTADQFRCVLDFFDLFVRRWDMTPTRNMNAEARIKDEAA
jgi:hypothetical protein